QRTDGGVCYGDEHSRRLYSKLLHYCPASACGCGCISHPAVADKERKKDSANNTTDAVDAEHIQRVVISKFVFKNDRKIAEAHSKNTEEQGAERFYDTGRGCDGNEISESTAGEPECCGLTLVEAFDDNPGECSGSCSNLCCSKRLRCAQATGEAATCVESKPPYPEQTCTDHGQDKIIRTNGKMGVKLSATNEDGGDKATYTCRDVNDSTTGKVDCTGSAQVEQEAIACPHPVCKGIVYENAPQCDEPAIGSKRYALGKGASDESGCDDGELGLEHGEHIFRYSTIQDAVVDTAKEKV